MKANPVEGPTFIGIGAPRSGSTWVSKILSSYSDVWVSPVKELRYFKGIWGVLEVEATYAELKEHRRKYVREWADMWYSGHNSSIEWYKSLFNQKHPVRGEISPLYSTMDREAVLSMHNVLPETKVFYSLREPFERDFSHFVYCVRKQRKRHFRSYAQEELDDIFEMFQDRSNYSEIMENYACYAEKGHFYTFFYDDIQQEPEKTMQGLCTFLGVKGHSAFDLSNRVNSTVIYQSKKTAYLKSYYWERYKDMYRERCLLLVQKLPDHRHVDRWMERYETGDLHASVS